ncbi:hypothetical protein LX36DRAFT_189284 [Colletotrichum falcatum]|nr:hypothetical protein LX36DRAFT_189284 [Colletotrichum falcatum]
MPNPASWSIYILGKNISHVPDDLWSQSGSSVTREIKARGDEAFPSTAILFVTYLVYFVICTPSLSGGEADLPVDMHVEEDAAEDAHVSASTTHNPRRLASL